MGGIYFWFPKITGRMLSEGLGKVHFWIMFIGFNLTFIPDAHGLGVNRPAAPGLHLLDRPDLGFGLINMIVSTVGAFIMGASFHPAPGRTTFSRACASEAAKPRVRTRGTATTLEWKADSTRRRRSYNFAVSCPGSAACVHSGTRKPTPSSPRTRRHRRKTRGRSDGEHIHMPRPVLLAYRRWRSA